MGVSHARCFTPQKTILFLLLKPFFCRENKSGYKKSKFFVVLAKTSTSVHRRNTYHYLALRRDEKQDFSRIAPLPLKAVCF